MAAEPRQHPAHPQRLHSNPIKILSEIKKAPTVVRRGFSFYTIVLLQFGQCLFDAAKGFAQQVLAGGVAQADAAVVAEGRAHHRGHVGLVEEVEGHVGRVLNLLAVEALAIVAAHVGEEIESTLRQAYLEAGDVAQQLVHHVAALLEDVAHVDDVLAGLGVHEHGAYGGLLGDGAGGAGDLALEFVGGLGDDGGGGDEADTPASHSEALGNTVDGDDALLDLGELGDAFVLAHKVDVLIDFVGHNEEVLMFGDHLGDALQLFLGVEHTGGVAGRGEHDEFGAGGDGCLELLGGHLEVVLEFGGHEDTFTLGQTDKLLVGDPEGGGDDDLVAGVDEALDDLEQALLGTSGDDNLLGLVLETVVAQELGADGFLEVGIAGHRRIVGEIVVDGLLGGFLHHLGGVEVGLADAEADDIFALSLELAGFGGHGESLALGHIEDSIGQDFHNYNVLMYECDNGLLFLFMEGEEVVCQEVPHCHDGCGDDFGHPEVPVESGVDKAWDDADVFQQEYKERVEPQADKGNEEELGIFDTDLFGGASPCPYTVEEVVACGGDRESDGVGQQFRYAEDAFAKSRQAEVDDGTAGSHHAELDEFYYERLEVHLVELLLCGAVDDAGLADFLLAVAGFRLADTHLGFLGARDNLDIAFFVNLQAIDFSGGEVAFDMPEMAAAAAGENDIGGQLLVAHILIPNAIEPNDMVAAVVGEAHILATVHAHVLVNDGAHTSLIVVIAVDISDAFLHQIFGIGNLFVGGGEAAVLTFHGEVDIHILVERPAMVIVAPYLGHFPFFYRFYIFLGVNGNAEKHDNKPQKQFLHYLFLVSFQLQKYSYFGIHANFFFKLRKMLYICTLILITQQ